MQTVLLPCIAKKIPHWFLPHSSTQLRIRPIWSSSIKVIIDQPFFLSASSHFLSLTTISLLFKQMAAEDYTFGPYKIHHTEVFYSTNLSYAMVNLRPLLPGHILYMRFSNTFLHVLICPKREVKRFGDLTADETSDLWLTAQKVGRQLETYHKASSLTLAIQMDEKEKELKQKLDLDKERKDRSLEEMSQEADEYRKLFL
ncbi:hypothetical protein JHK82_049403 [Glycine max]|nr:hypothetical protein JHK86_049260 [Glycine max]KAG5090625.1 hypothetical protein JHK82_049403 [Glycine max]KAG5093712.1 hypothetical protein JHK84_049300 [Glycine max]